MNNIKFINNTGNRKNTRYHLKTQWNEMEKALFLKSYGLYRTGFVFYKALLEYRTYSQIKAYYHNNFGKKANITQQMILEANDALQVTNMQNVANKAVVSKAIMLQRLYEQNTGQENTCIMLNPLNQIQNNNICKHIHNLSNKSTAQHTSTKNTNVLNNINQEQYTGLQQQNVSAHQYLEQNHETDQQKQQINQNDNCIIDSQTSSTNQQSDMFKDFHLE